MARVIFKYISKKFVCEVLIVRAFRFHSPSICRAAGPPLIIRHLDLYPAFFSRPITHNGAICVMFQLGRFRRTSAASGHASNTRSPPRDLAWTGLGTCPESAKGERTGCRRVSFLPARLACINPTFSTSSIYLALLIPRVFVCTCTHDFLPRGEEGKRKVEEQPATRSGEGPGRGISGIRRWPGGLTLPRILHLPAPSLFFSFSLLNLAPSSG